MPLNDERPVSDLSGDVHYDILPEDFSPIFNSSKLHPAHIDRIRNILLALDGADALSELSDRSTVCIR